MKGFFRYTALALILGNGTLLTAQTAWTNGSGYWSDATKWNPPVPPGPGTNVFFTNNIPSHYTVTNNVLNNTFGNLVIFRPGILATLYNDMNGFNPAGDVILGSGGRLIISNSTATIGGSVTISNLGRLLVFDGANVTVQGTLNSAYGVWIQGTNTVLSVLGGGVSSSSTTHPYLFTAPQDLQFFNNGTLNIGGTNAASANESFVSFTNSGYLTFNGLNNGFVGSSSGATNGTINASTNVVGFYNAGIIQNVSGSGGGVINATFINETTGQILPGPYGAQFVFERFPTNRGLVYLWNHHTLVRINQGDFVNQGRVNLENNHILLPGGHFINDTNGVLVQSSQYGGSIQAKSVLNKGTIALTNGYVNPLAITCVLTNEGLLSFYRYDYGAFRNTHFGLTASNIINSGTILVLGQTNIWPTNQKNLTISSLATPVTNLVGGTITTTNGGILGFATTTIPRNLGKILIQDQSAISMGTAVSGGSYNDIVQMGQSGFRNEGTVDIRGGVLAVAHLTNVAGATLAGQGDIGFMVISNLISGSQLTTNLPRFFGARPIGNAGTIQLMGLLNAGAVTNHPGGLITGSGELQSYDITHSYSGETLVTTTNYLARRLVNFTGAEVLAATGTLTLANGIVNLGGTVTVSNGATLQLGSPAVVANTNSGLFQLLGGTIATGNLLNNSNILFAGAPSTIAISSALTNAATGVIQVSGTTGTVTSSLAQLGTIHVQNGLLSFSGNGFLLAGSQTWLTNNGTLQFGGFVTNAAALRFANGASLLATAVTNSGAVLATNGTGQISGPLVNRGTFIASGPTTVMSLLDGGVNSSATFIVNSNATVNIGGTSQAAANASSAVLTNAAGSTMTLAGNNTFATLNASTTGVGIVNQGNLNVSGAATATVNAVVLNDSTGYILVGSSFPTLLTVDSIPTNRGTIYLWNVYNAMRVNRGQMVNEGKLAIDINTLTVGGGPLINEAGGVVNLQAYSATINVPLLINLGTLTATNATYQGANVQGVLSNVGTIKLYRVPAVQSDTYAVLTASNIVNAGTIVALSKTNTWTYRDSDYAVNWITSPVTNLAGGVLTATNGTFLAIGEGAGGTPLKNFGTLIVNSNSIVAVGSSTPIFGGTMLQMGQNNFVNDGTVQVRDGIFAVNSLSNAAGGIVQGRGDIGFVAVSNLISGSSLTTNYVKQFTARPIANRGLIAPDGLFNAGAITNLAGGQIIGTGVIASYNVVHYYSGETLLFSNAHTGARILNQAGATLLASGGSLILSNGLVNDSNAGLIGATNGGLLQIANGTTAWTNNGILRLMSGSLKSGDIQNNNAIQFEQGGNSLLVGGTLTIAPGAILTASNATASVAGLVNSLGTIQVVNSTITFSNPVTMSGLYSSDPSTNTFVDDVTVNPSGALVGGPGDLFDFKKSLQIQSTNHLGFNLDLSEVRFSGSGVHTNAVTGGDFGTNSWYGGDNFGYGRLTLASPADQIQFLSGGFTNGGAAANALYVREVALWNGVTLDSNLVANLFSPFNIYYLKAEHAPFNTYLDDQIFPLVGGGFLIPVVPEPGTLALLAPVVLAVLRRRTKVA